MVNDIQIIEDLKQAGFDDGDLQQSIVQRIHLGIPSFVAPYAKWFDVDKVEYNLHLRRLNDLGDYGLEGYEVDGINTYLLEKRMADIDWFRFPIGSKEEREISEVLDLLWRLGQSADISGFNIQELLLLKYLKGTPYDSPELQEKRMLYQTSGRFGRNENGRLFNAFLCYYELSGIGAGLKEQLQRKGFDCDREIEQLLSDNYEYFELHTYRSCREGLMHW